MLVILKKNTFVNLNGMYCLEKENIQRTVASLYCLGDVTILRKNVLYPLVYI